MPITLKPDQVTLEFKTTSKGLEITILTPRLKIRSVHLSDSALYATLFSDPDVMAKYAAGIPQTDTHKIKDRIDGWVRRWQRNDPFSGMAVFNKTTGEFMGHGIIGRSGKEGICECAGMLHKSFWHMRYASEISSAMMQHLLPVLIAKDYQLDGYSLHGVEATTRTDHPAVQRLLEGVGFQTNRKEISKFGTLRYTYTADTSVLCSRHAAIQNKYAFFSARNEYERNRQRNVGGEMSEALRGWS